MENQPSTEGFGHVATAATPPSPNQNKGRKICIYTESAWWHKNTLPNESTNPLKLIWTHDCKLNFHVSKSFEYVSEHFQSLPNFPFHQSFQIW